MIRTNIDARRSYHAHQGHKVPKPLQEINSIAHKLPFEVLQDIHKRIGDWLSGGGKEDDPYIEQLLRFARNYLRVKEEK